MPRDKIADHELGESRARVTLVEYGDFECPYCARAHERVASLLRQFGDGLKFVFRNFPLTELHENAMRAAQAAEAAGLQGQFWPMYDLLYENQDELDEAALFGYAEELELDMKKFRKDFGAKAVMAKIKADIASGEEAGVEGTPQFFIDQVKFEGDWNGAELAEALSAALSESARGERPPAHSPHDLVT